MSKTAMNIGEVVCTMGYCTASQVKAAATWQRELEKNGLHVYLGDVLVRRGDLTREQLEHALRLQKDQRTPSKTVRAVGEMAAAASAGMREALDAFESLPPTNPGEEDTKP